MTLHGSPDKCLMKLTKIPLRISGAAPNLPSRNCFAGHDGEDNGAASRMWFRLQFHSPSLTLILVASGLFIVLTPLLASHALDYGMYVGIYLFLLSLVVLLPLAFKANTASGLQAFPAAPFVGLNFLYFVLGTLVPLVYPDTQFPTISLPGVPTAILILALGFAFFGAGLFLSGASARTWIPKHRDSVSVQGMGYLLAIIAIAVWVMRICFAAEGYGITHVGGGILVLPPQLQPVAVLLSGVQYLPVCLCITRLCSSSLSPRRVGAWQLGLGIILTADIFYFTMTGNRLALLWELLILIWAVWLRLIPRFSRRWYAYAGLLLVVAVPLISAQRIALGELAPEAGENHLELSRDLIPEQARLLQDSTWDGGGSNFGSELGRFTGVAPVSAVSGKILNEGYPLMWGETLKEGLPFLVPRAFWPSKPEQLNVDVIIERDFDLPINDDLTLIQTECVANFGIVGLCLWMFLFGVITNRFFCCLIKVAPYSEPLTACLLVMLPVIFNVETDITGALAGLRIVPAFYALLMLLSIRGESNGMGHSRPSYSPRAQEKQNQTSIP